MKRISWIAAVAFLTSGWGPVTTPRSRVVLSDPVVEERIEYYEVSGSSARELILAMNVAGPQGAQGLPPLQSAAATTRWDVHWQVQYSLGGGRCSIKSFSTSVPILITLPRWPGRVAGSPLAERWDRLMQHISAHERGHAEHGILAAKAIQERVSALEPAWTCQALADSIKSTSEALIAKYRQEDAEYDRVAPKSGFETEDDDRAAWTASRGRVPLRRSEPTVAEQELTDTERQRRKGTTEFETDMAQLSAKADRADVAWRRYIKDCRVDMTRVAVSTTAGGRDWFGYAWAATNSTGQTVVCAEARTFYALADQVKDGICLAEEKARRSSVYPGTRRELRRAYRLEWDGWDQDCR